MKLVCLWPYTVPKLHEENFNKEVEHLVLLGVFGEENDSKWGAPYFTQPNPKTNWVCLLTDFSNINRQLKRKPYNMLKKNYMLLKLEGFTHAILLNLNMGYYHIRLSEDTSNWCTIILPWGKYYYKHLPMGVSNSPENFQQKMNDLF